MTSFNELRRRHRQRLTARKFRQRPHIKKKVRSEDYKRRMEWREHKGVNRDNAKVERPWYAGCCKTFMTKLGHKQDRRWVRERIAHGDYSLEKKWRKTHIDPWKWY
jgi:hypothetical protein